jgi:flagellar hook assembly protein FlgD
MRILLNVPAGASTLKLVVYTLAGEEVRTVFHGNAPPGQQMVDWDGTNSRGSQVASGGYLLVVDLPDGSRAVRKIAIVKK